MGRITHTYVVLEVSAAAYREISDKLRAAGYNHLFHDEGGGRVVVDMSGIAIGEEPREEPRPEDAPEGPPPTISRDERDWG